MRIVMTSSEAYPFSKTGGLGDVASALCRALNELGHEVWLFVPHYPRLYEQNRDRLPALEKTGMFVEIPIASKSVRGELLWTQLPHSDVTVMCVHQPHYFDRDSLYTHNGRDYGDNCERFSFFSRAVMEICRRLIVRPDVLHANDWQTGLIPALLAVEYRAQPEFRHTASVLTIHNLAFQGRFWHWDMLLTGLDWKYFNWQQMESYGQLNLLKTGLSFADKITTVSPTYAQEIQTEIAGHGLHGLLHDRRDDLVGILNGIDSRIWNAAFDPALSAHYDAANVEQGKADCKQDLQQQLGLPQRGDVPVFGMISRMTDQKGFDLILAIADELLTLDLQLVFLGQGEASIEHQLTELQRRYPQKVSATIGFSEELAHRIEAGSDLYLMPSRFEPCGLNQLYSLAYGTLPIVHKTGGLADSVRDASDENLADGTATGFVFDHYRPGALQFQIERALSLYSDRTMWYRLVRTAMTRDFSWRRSAEKYLSVYRAARERHVRHP